MIEIAARKCRKIIVKPRSYEVGSFNFGWYSLLKYSKVKKRYPVKHVFPMQGVICEEEYNSKNNV